MSSPIDEDAPTLATVAATSIGLLSDATGPEVGYPGLDGTGDVEDVLAALSRMAGDLQQTATQLTRYLDDEVAAGHLTRAPGSTDQNARTVAAAMHALTDVQENARTLARLLTTAETAMLALRPGG
ncbi:hypothetical protein FB565_003390 [Actinoplanes lutulentus]|uniref:Uncharacterized protein n=1 Tax=Actinoplanes lutulentus TaxID=1287878 RepID=A0A327Z3D2_9ACTN|nr:hypothetical protein [Actinoplanes lutulentus]MBB2943661.1 hypothetical protein [Actinoplanes lutulentus]RAK27525.1 hypothetical protein B0I29_123159 [Actinoplanes lutulentus]